MKEFLLKSGIKIPSISNDVKNKQKGNTVPKHTKGNDKQKQTGNESQTSKGSLSEMTIYHNVLEKVNSSEEIMLTQKLHSR